MNNNEISYQQQSKNILSMIAVVEAVTKEIIWHSTKQIKTPIDVCQISKFYNMHIVYDSTLNPNCSGKIFITSDNQATASINEHDHPLRQRFTIAHELGHFYSYRKQGKTGEITEYRNQSIINAESIKNNTSENIANQVDQLEEAYANIFAANLLVPRFLLTEILKLNRNLNNIANMFEVSQEMLQYRINSLFANRFQIKDNIIQEVI